MRIAAQHKIDQFVTISNDFTLIANMGFAPIRAELSNIVTDRTTHLIEASLNQIDNDIGPNFKFMATIWWSFIWRFILATAAVGFVVGFLDGCNAALAHIPYSKSIGGTWIVYLSVIPASFWALRVVIRKYLNGKIPR